MSEAPGQANSQPAAAPQAAEAIPGQAPGGDLPSLQDVINNFSRPGETATSEPVTPANEDPGKSPVEPEKPGLTEFERIQRQENELFKQKKQFADERKEFEARKKQFDDSRGEFDNYMDNFGENDDKTKESEYEELTYDELQKKIREDVFKEIDAKDSETKEQQETDKAINSFKENISTLLSEKVSEFPLAAAEGLGGADLIYQTIDAQFEQDEKDYGFERAEQMMLSPEQAAQKVEKYIAQQMQTMLKSEGVKAFLQKELGFQAAEGRKLNDSNQLRDTPKTLTNSEFNQSSHGQVDIDNMNDEEALEYSLSFVTPGGN